MQIVRNKRILAALLALPAACGSSRTELIIGVATDFQATGQLDGVDLLVTRADNGKVVVETSFTITGRPDMPNNLPGSYGIFSDGEETKLNISLTGTKAGAPLVTRRAVLNLVSGQTIFYRLGLAAACMSKTDCLDGQDCAEGQCVAVALASNRFPDFSAEVVDTVTCNGNTTYLDTTTNTPMPSSGNAAQCPPELCREGTCINPLAACSAETAIANCKSAIAACNVGCMTDSCAVGGDPLFCDNIPSTASSPDCLAAICASFECASRATNWGAIGTDGTCGLLECQGEFADQGLACNRDTEPAATAWAGPELAATPRR